MRSPESVGRSSVMLFGLSRTSTPVRATQVIFIGQIWPGRYMQPAAASQRNKSGMRSLVDAAFRKRAIQRGNETMRSEQRSKPLLSPNRSAESAAPLWTARRKYIAARRRNACRSRLPRLMSCVVASRQARLPYVPLRLYIPHRAVCVKQQHVRRSRHPLR
jgi:hypothetical protein